MKAHIIDQDKLFCIDMFSDWGWQELRKRCKSITKNSSPEVLADGFVDFQIVWQEDNGYDISDIESPEKTTKRGQYFFCGEHEEPVFYKGNLFNDLLTRYTDYILGD